MPKICNNLVAIVKILVPPSLESNILDVSLL